MKRLFVVLVATVLLTVVGRVCAQDYGYEPSITLTITPDHDGDTTSVNSSYTITWESYNLSNREYCVILYFTKAQYSVHTYALPSSGSYKWEPPAEGNYQIKAVLYPADCINGNLTPAAGWRELAASSTATVTAKFPFLIEIIIWVIGWVFVIVFSTIGFIVGVLIEIFGPLILFLG